jgi:S1-C subfamily serine protease
MWSAVGGVEIGATPKGVMVGNIVVRSPAHKAGIQPGDVILALGGKKITNPMELQDSIAALRPGTKVNVLIQRNDVKKSLSLIAESMPRAR